MTDWFDSALIIHRFVMKFGVFIIFECYELIFFLDWSIGCSPFFFRNKVLLNGLVKLNASNSLAYLKYHSAACAILS